MRYTCQQVHSGVRIDRKGQVIIDHHGIQQD